MGGSVPGLYVPLNYSFVLWVVYADILREYIVYTLYVVS